MSDNLIDLLGETALKDPTWKKARDVVAQHLVPPSHVVHLFRSAWNGQADGREFLKVLGFSRLNPACLLDAAGLPASSESNDASQIEQALQILGPRLSAVVLAVNLFCRVILSKKPTSAWRRILEETMTNIEIGYKLGARVFDLGVEGGSLIGFSISAGYGLLLAHNERAFKDWMFKRPADLSRDRKLELKFFNCEGYQISALALQQLGFGHEIAIGVACATGGLKNGHLDLERGAFHWKAAYKWVEALRDGRNYPADLQVRNYFPETAPSQPGQAKNVVLEVLYTEIAKVRQGGSKWTWHLPRPGYQQTMEYLAS